MELPTRAAEVELDSRGGALIRKSRGADDRLLAAEQLYMACRVTTLAAAVTQMTGFDLTSEIGCEVCLDHLFLRFAPALTPLSQTWLITVRVSRSFFFARCSGGAHGNPPDILEHLDDFGNGTIRAA